MERTIRTVIVDDEPLARELLVNYLKHEPGIEVVGQCANGAEAVAAVHRLQPDLLLLDVQMPDLDGFEVLQHLDPEAMPVIVFVTGRDEYALRAFEANALDYLLKPFDRQRLGTAIARARQEIGHRQSGTISGSLRSLLENMQAESRMPERFLVKVGGHVLFVKTEQIDWIEAEGNYARLHAGADVYLLRETMSALAERLDPKKFVRVHRSAIVRIERIKEMEPSEQGEYKIVLQDGTRIPMSRTFRGKWRQIFKNRSD